KVVAFAKDAKLAGVDAVVCSPKETSFIRKKRKLDELKLFNPGIRPDGAQKNDQQRVTTPKQAILNGADFVVIGRPITQPPKGKGIINSRDAVERIAEEILEALVEMEKKEK
ncbi:MAG: orotidine 5'-phosphate decarboxylase, partial [Candidatus Aenigmatarchaeota archaeon]